jgi:DNA repair exonuclease SbcCD ATPase subunit
MSKRASEADHPTKVDWQIPLQGKLGEWYPVIRVGRHVPFGYEQDKEDDMLLIPIPEELELLEKAKKFLKDYSVRQVAKWLSDQSGRSISHVGLYKRVRMEEKRRRASSNYRQYAKKYKEAARKSQKIEEERLGGKHTRSLDADEGYIKLERGECCPFCGQTRGNI